MPDISIQFHATSEEIAGFVDSVLQETRVIFVAMRFFPFEIMEPAREDLWKLIVNDSKVTRLAFTLQAPSLDVENELEFAEKNRNHLRLEIGKKIEKGLDQSWLVARTDDESALVVWRAIAKRLRAMTMPGVTAVNLITGETVKMRSFRFTTGAVAAEASGVPILGPSGVPNLRFDVTV